MSKGKQNEAGGHRREPGGDRRGLSLDRRSSARVRWSARREGVRGHRLAPARGKLLDEPQFELAYGRDGREALSSGSDEFLAGW